MFLAISKKVTTYVVHIDSLMIKLTTYDVLRDSVMEALTTCVKSSVIPYCVQSDA